MRPALFSPPRPSTLLLAAALPAAVFAAGAPVDDPLQSAACRSALARIHEQEASALAAASAAAGARERGLVRLQALRVEAARRCLAEREDPPPVRRRAQPPLSPTQPAAPSASAAGGGRSPSPAPGITPAPRPAAPPTVTMCDPAGCWLSDGTRLNRVGPLLMGPSGVCLINGTSVACP